MSQLVSSSNLFNCKLDNCKPRELCKNCREQFVNQLYDFFERSKAYQSWSDNQPESNSWYTNSIPKVLNRLDWCNVWFDRNPGLFEDHSGDDIQEAMDFIASLFFNHAAMGYSFDVRIVKFISDYSRTMYLLKSRNVILHRTNNAFYDEMERRHKEHAFMMCNVDEYLEPLLIKDLVDMVKDYINDGYIPVDSDLYSSNEPPPLKD